MKLHFKDFSSSSRTKGLPAKGNHDGEVHIWIHALHFDDPFLRLAPYLLSSDELLRAARYHFEKDRRVYESGHVFIRKVLSHYTQIEPADLQLSPIVNQKPRLGNSPFPIHFNITHSANKIIVAIGFNSDVGIDVEKVIPDFDMHGFSEANYHPNEQSKFRSLKNDQESDYFYKIWTRKEAWLKLTGEGVNDKLKTLDFSETSNEFKVNIKDHPDLYMYSWKETPEYMVTLATFKSPSKIKLFTSKDLTETIEPESSDI
jgi:4'-phosphopantetheinyl transferase